MSTKRIKKTIPEITSREQLEHVVGQIGALDREQEGIRLEMEKTIAQIRENNETRLVQLSSQAEILLEAVEAWATAHPEDFGKKKSLERLHGTIGYRTGKHQLKPLGRLTWDSILAGLRRLAWGAAYIRIKEEVDKERLISDRLAESLSAEELHAANLRIVQNETFFVEPKTEAPASA